MVKIKYHPKVHIYQHTQTHSKNRTIYINRHVGPAASAQCIRLVLSL